MYLHLGASAVIRKQDVLAILDLDNSSASHITRAFLSQAEREGRLEVIGEDIPRALVLCRDERGGRVYLTQLSPAALARRFVSGKLETL